ncbi:MAG TPA: hypothetical protein VIL34_04760 [Actinopolymorphaceae bacterium]|jgi:hypothetical protein
MVESRQTSAAHTTSSELPGRSWPEGDQLFRGDPHWVGGDGAYSIQVGDDRVIWIFADTFISLAGLGRRQAGDAVMINNSLGVQTGLDPTTASMRFCWRTSPEGRPASFFADEGEGYFWPGNAVLLGDRLLAFLARVRPRTLSPEEAAETLPVWNFEGYGWAAVLVSNPYDEPEDWQIRYLPPVEFQHAKIVGFGAVWLDGDYVYAHTDARSVEQGQHLARWHASDAADGHLQDAQWWCGEDAGWRAEQDVVGRPALTVDQPQSEFTVHRDRTRNQLVWVQTSRLYHADILVRTGSRPEGPWSRFVPVFHPPEGDKPHGFTYAAKAHPELRPPGDELLLTYNNNSESPTGLMDDPELYYPRFVRVPSDVLWQASG